MVNLNSGRMFNLTASNYTLWRPGTEDLPKNMAGTGQQCGSSNVLKVMLATTV